MTSEKKPLDKKLLAAAVGLFVVGFVLGQNNNAFSPFGPQEPDRPFLRFIAKAAKFGLWLMVVEPPPEIPEHSYVSHDMDVINHRRGW